MLTERGQTPRVLLQVVTLGVIAALAVVQRRGHASELFSGAPYAPAILDGQGGGMPGLLATVKLIGSRAKNLGESMHE